MKFLPTARLHKQSFRPPFSKGGRARARCHSRRGSPRWHSRPLGWPSRRRTRPRVCVSKVFVHLFQKVADSKGSAFGRWPQPAERPTLQAYLGGLGAFTRERPPRPLPIPPAQAANGLPAGEVARSARGGPSFVFAACGRPAGSPSSFFLLDFPASCRRGCRVPPRQAGYFLARARK